MIIQTAALLADHWDHDGPGWWFAFVPIIWIAVIAGLVLLYRRGGWGGPGSGSGGPAQPAQTALDVLGRRFAAGEIDADEYRRRREVLADDR